MVQIILSTAPRRRLMALRCRCLIRSLIVTSLAQISSQRALWIPSRGSLGLTPRQILPRCMRHWTHSIEQHCFASPSDMVVCFQYVFLAFFLALSGLRIERSEAFQLAAYPTKHGVQLGTSQCVGNS